MRYALLLLRKSSSVPPTTVKAGIGGAEQLRRGLYKYGRNKRVFQCVTSVRIATNIRVIVLVCQEMCTVFKKSEHTSICTEGTDEVAIT